ncbi:hypothetical protein [Streptomyces canus]|nr:hypothetical protein [Streptomyces canus]WSD92255.1 hypothetical protein OG925_25160 [Streptomyces canus]
MRTPLAVQRTSLEVGLADPLRRRSPSNWQPRGRCRSSETRCCCAIW